MTCALRLLEQERRVRILADRRTPDTTSNRAGAVFSPFRIEGHERAGQWTQRAYSVLSELAEREPAAGVAMTPLRELFFRRLDGDPWWAGFVRGYERQSTVPAGYADSERAIVPRMNMQRYMPWLEARVLELGGEIACEHVTDLRSAFATGAQVVVNCSGLGAKALANDPAMTPMRGQILHVRSGMNIPECIVEDGIGARTTYVFPFEEYTVLGGTYERGETVEATSETELCGIIERCSAMLRACGHSGVEGLVRERLRDLAGLRPARVVGGVDEAVRLETERIGDDQWVIHNYGHGRAGVTLSWGCAEDVAARVAEVFETL